MNDDIKTLKRNLRLSMQHVDAISESYGDAVRALCAMAGALDAEHGWPGQVTIDVAIEILGDPCQVCGKRHGYHRHDRLGS